MINVLNISITIRDIIFGDTTSISVKQSDILHVSMANIPSCDFYGYIKSIILGGIIGKSAKKQFSHPLFTINLPAPMCMIVRFPLYL